MNLRDQRQERAHLACLVERLKLHPSADAAEIATIRSLWRTAEQHRPHEPVKTATPRIITSGWAAWCREIDNGRNVIFLLLLPGDVITSAIADGANDCKVVAASRLCTVAGDDLARADRHGSWPAPKAKALIDGADSEYRLRVLDHLTWLSEHDGARNLACLLVELHDRLAERGLCANGRFDLPIGQRILAQALGLSVVQVNKILARHRSDGLLSCERGWLQIDDGATLRAFTKQGHGGNAPSPWTPSGGRASRQMSHGQAAHDLPS